MVVDGEHVLVGSGGRTIELIDVGGGTSALVGDLGSPGFFATTTALGDGLILLLGGYDEQVDLRRQVRLIPTP